MKKTALFLLLLLFAAALSACSGNLTDRSDIVSLFRKNEDLFT